MGIQISALHPFGILERVFCNDCASKGMTHQHELALDLEQRQRGLQVVDQLRHIIAAPGLVRKSMPAQVDGDDAILHGKLLQLVMPLLRLAPEAVDEDKRPLGMIRRDVDRRKPDQRICRHAHFMPIKIEVDVHSRQFI